MNYKRIYIIATVSTISLILLNQLFIQYWLFQKKYDAQVINVSGRQRMLSQRIFGLFCYYADSRDAKTERSIQSAFAQWEKAHFALLHGDDKVGIKYRIEEASALRLERLTPRIQAAKAALGKLDLIDQNLIVELQTNQDAFLVEMNQIVSELEKSSNRKLRFIVVMEILLALLSLGVIYFEVQFVFRRITNKLVSKNTSLEQSNQLLEQYAYLASHDLKAPTQNILAFSQMLKERLNGRLDTQEQISFQYIIQAAERMQETTDDLLKFSSVNQGALNMANHNPLDIIQDAQLDLNEQILHTKANILINELPAQVRGDKVLLKQVFQNLLSNGMKFTPKDVIPKLEIDCQITSDEYHFKVKDNGIGIAPQNQHKIFGLFKRLHRREEFNGTGIGLAICQKIIEKHKGRMWVSSEEGKGSEFYFSIPK